MADTKITQLQPPQVGYPVVPATDVLPIVVIADPGMATSGSTRKVTVNQLLGAGGTATLASATITGDLTVDANSLYVNSSTNNVGLGTLTPSAASGRALEIYGGAGQSRIALKNDATGSASTDGSQIALVGSQLVIQNREASEITFETNNSERYRIASDGVATWSNVGGTSGTAMTINANGLGVGGSAAARIHAIDSGGGCALFTRAAAPAAALSAIYIQAPVSSGFSSSPVMNFWYQNTGISNPANECFAIRTNSTDRLYIDASGNVGIGVTPAGTGGCLQLKSGITFPATQVASSDANTLDDYEEGTWTPTIKGTSTSGTGTYSVQVGTYTKVGRVVYFQGRITWSAHTGTGDMQIGGIPFTALSTANSNSTCNFGYVNNISLAASSVLTGFVFPGTNDIGLYQYTAGGGVASTVAIDAAADIMFSGFYFV